MFVSKPFCTSGCAPILDEDFEISFVIIIYVFIHKMLIKTSCDPKAGQVTKSIVTKIMSILPSSQIVDISTNRKTIVVAPLLATADDAIMRLKQGPI